MLIKTLNCTKAKTDEEYEKILRSRQKIYVVLGAVGIITLALGIYFGSIVNEKQTSFMSGVYTGIGFGLLAVSIIWYLKIRKLLKNAKALRAARLEAQDERTAAVNQKASSVAGLMLICLAYAGLLIAGFFSMTVYWTLIVVVLGYFVCFCALKAYYDKKM